MSSGAQAFARNTLALLLEQVVGKALGYTVLILTARLLGDQLFGQYTFILTFVGYFSVVSEFGLGVLSIREVARDRAKANLYLVNSVLVKMGLSLATLLIILAVTAILAKPAEVKVALLIAALSLFVGSTNTSLLATLSAHERLDYRAYLAIAGNIFSAALVILLLLSGYKIVALVSAMLVTGVFTLITSSVIVYTRLFRFHLEIDLAFCRWLIKESFPFALNAFLIGIYFRIDITMLSLMKGDTMVGWYSAAYRFLDQLVMIPGVIVAPLYPMMSRLYSVSREAIAQPATRAFRLMLLLGFPIAIGTTLFADDIILLFYGESYRNSIVALQLLIWAIPFIFINWITHNLLYAINRQRIVTLVAIINMVANIGANLWAIPRFGYIGACITTIMSEVITTAVYFSLAKGYLKAGLSTGFLAKGTASITLMTLVAILLKGGNILWIAPVVAAVYLGALIMLRTFTEDEMQAAKNLIRRAPAQGGTVS